MNCLRCGANIGDGLGLCPACRAAAVGLSTAQSLPSKDDPKRSFPAAFGEFLQNIWQNPQLALNIAGGIFLLVFVFLFIEGAGLSSTAPADFKRAPGVLVPEEPLQTPTAHQPWSHEGWDFRPLAAFSIRARVLVRAHFTLAGGSDISPYDFTLGWGPMSDTAILKRMRFTHGYRMVFWNSDNWPISPQETIRHASNLHAIPASNKVARELAQVEVEDIVRFRGFLVEASRADGASWTSSTSREDDGDGACEVMWIEEVMVEK